MPDFMTPPTGSTDMGPVVRPRPPIIQPPDPRPGIEAVIPPEGETRPPPQVPPLVVIEPVEKPPRILPGPPDITPPTIVPPVYEEPAPDPFPVDGAMPPTYPPPSIITVSGGTGFGTFMVYVGRKLVLTMAASLGTSLGKSAGAMLVGAVNKQLFRGTTIRFHTGQAFGDVSSGTTGSSASTKGPNLEQAWRLLPQEFSYWEK